MAAAYVLFADQINPNSTKQEIAQLSQKIAHPVAHKSAKASADINSQAMDRDYLAGREDLAAFVRDEVSAANQEWFGNLARGFNEYMQGDVNWDGDGEFEDGSRIVVRDDKESRNSSSTGKNSLYDKTSLRPNQAYDHYKKPARAEASKNTNGVGSIPNNKQYKTQNSNSASAFVIPDSDPGSILHNQKYNRFNKRARTSYRPTELDLMPQDMLPIDERFLEGQGGEGATFPHFVFGNKTHAFVAGETGLWHAQIKAKAKEGAEESEEADDEKNKSRAATTRSPGASNQVVLTQPEKITLNGAASQDSPLIEPISHLTLYGDKKRPAVVVGDADAGEPEMSIKIFAAVDDAATSFINNDTDNAEGKFYDATTPVPLEINQSIVGLTASSAKDRFFVAVADGGTVDRTLYSRPEKWDTETVRNAIIAGMKKTDVMNNPKDDTLATVNPETAPITAENAAYVQAVTTSIGNTVFLSGIDADPALYAKRAFRDAINLRKGGLIDLAVAAAGAGHTAPDTLKEMADAATIIEKQTKADSGKNPVKTADLGDDEAKTLAAAIQVGLGWGINQLAASIKKGTDTLAATGDTKPFASLNSITAETLAAKAAKSDMSIYVADQDGGSRGVCVADLAANKITTKNGAGNFIIKPGKIITKAMYEGIDLTKEDALAPAFGKLEEVGIPCAVYSAADAYPATQAIINGNIDMVYDDQLNRLFVGFEDICLGDNAGSLTNGSGAVCSVMVGQEKVINTKPSLYFQPIIANFGPLLFQENLEPTIAARKDFKLTSSTDFIAGFYQKHDPAKLATAVPGDDFHASAKKLRVMHTSTGKDYLLFNGGVATKANFDNLGSKVYALPLVGPYDLKNNDVSAAGQIAKATRPAGVDFYKKGLKDIDFLNPVGDIGDLKADNSGIVDTAVGKEYYSLSDLHTKTKTFVTNILTDWGTTTPVGTAESKALWQELEKEKNYNIQAGLASLALQSCYGSNTAKTPADTDAAAAAAFNLITGRYDHADPKNIQQSNLLEKIEQVGIDIAVAEADAAKRFKEQAPAYDIARYVISAKISGAAGENSEANIWNNQVKLDHTKRFGVPADDLKVETGKVGVADAGGIAGGVAAVEGTLGWAIKNIYDGANLLHTKKLIPAIQTMHTDAAFPAFDYVRVGYDAKRLSYDTSALVQDVQVVGDTVYVSLGGNRDAGHTDEAGVFASTAIFNEAGFVRSWSPWRRVLGQNKPVGGIALDAQTSRYWYTANKNSDPITDEKKLDAVRVTSWGRGFNKSESSDSRLSTALDGVFGDIGGIFGLYSFGPDTPGFKPRDPSSGTPANRHEQFSMTVATGNGRVALIKTGAFDKHEAGGIFVPTAHAAGGYVKHDGPTPGANIFVFDAAISAANNDNAGTALANLGLITCAEVSRLPLADSPNDSRGWLFVGGSGGLAVLTRWNTGRGWNTGMGQGLADLLPGTQRDDFPAGAGWRFMQILVNDPATNNNPFTDVRKLVSDGSRYLYVMTAKAIWRIDMAAVPAGNTAPFIGGIAGGRTMQRYGIFQRKEFAPNASPAAPANNEYAVVLVGDELAHEVAGMDAQTTVPADIFADKEAGQFLDMMVGYHKATSPAIGAGGAAVVDEANAKTQLIIGTTNGLFYNANDKLPDAKPAAAPEWTQLTAAGGTAIPADDPIKGPVMRLEFTSSQVGDQLKKPIDQDKPVKQTQYYADGNLHVTAFSADKKALAVYRFNLSAADWQNPTKLAITPFVEPYNISGDDKKTTPYFYKVGTLNKDDDKKIEFGGPLDYFTRTAHVTGSTDGFADGVWMTPQLSDFERDEATGHFEDIDLGYDLTLPLYLGNIQIEPASGAQIVTGEFGLRVND